MKKIINYCDICGKEIGIKRPVKITRHLQITHTEGEDYMYGENDFELCLSCHKKIVDYIKQLKEENRNG